MTKDMTRGNPAKLILFFTIPLLLGNLFQQFYNMADTMIVGRTIGVNALAAVGATGSIMFLILGFAQGLTAGLAVITAQRFGAEDITGVRRSIAASLVISGGVTVVLTLVAVATARPILELMQTPPEILDDATRYITVIYWGIFASMLFNLLSNIIRALGDSRTPLIFLVIACLVNIVLDFAFILGLHMGVEGAAVATVISQALSGVLCIFYMLKKLSFLRFHPGDWKMEWEILSPHLRVSLPMAFQSSIIAIGSIILQWALNQLGATAVASFTAAQKIDQLATQPLMSFGITMATYAAQNYGASNIPRIRVGVRQCTYMSVAASILGGLLTIWGGPFLVQLFVGQQPEVISLAQIYLRINGATYFILALLFIYRYTLQGLGRSLVPTIAGIMELVMRTLAALALAAPLGFTGVSMANPIAWIGATVPLCIAYFLTIRRLSELIPPPVKEDSAPQPTISSEH